MNKRYTNPDNDHRGVWKPGDMVAAGLRTEGSYTVRNPNNGIEFNVPTGKHWAFSKQTMQVYIDDNRIFFGKNGKQFPSVKQFLSEVKQGLVPSSLFTYQRFGHTDEAKKDFIKLFGDEGKSLFETLKPLRLLKMLMLIAPTQDNDIILDFFAGSGTTAQAVMQLNAEDGGNRKYICVQLPEVTDEKSEAYKAGYKTIADIARERIRRAGKKIMADNADKLSDRKTPLDIGFKDFAVAPSNFEEVPTDATDQTQLLLVNNLKSGVKDEDLLTQLRLLQGKTLDIEPTKATFGDLTVYVQDETCFVLQASANLADLKQLLQANYSKIVLLDRLFKDSKDMTNFDQEYQALDSQKIIEIC